MTYRVATFMKGIKSHRYQETSRISFHRKNAALDLRRIKSVIAFMYNG